MAKRRYDDKFRANAVVMLEAAGYPKTGALSQVSQHLNVPLNTLKGWATAASNPVPTDVRTEKRKELSELLRKEIDAALGEMNNARQDASYRDLGTVAGILIDKLQLINNKPTANLEFSDPIPIRVVDYRHGLTTVAPGSDDDSE